jgi:hypothetical protein
VLVNTALTAGGFAVLAYSLYVTEEPPTVAWTRPTATRSTARSDATPVG